jgi:cell fate (sporulation/competence/biofilm development) regulator YlbF (YheA/YmcA/DUF963 family)
MLEEKAKDLGRLIGQSEEFKALKRATDALGADREASALQRRMEELQDKAHGLINSGQEPGADMKRELDELLRRMHANDTYQRALVAETNYEKLMVRVNEWIADGVQKGAASPIITLG